MRAALLLSALLSATSALAQTTTALPETSVSEHMAVSTNDGRVIIEVLKVQQNTVSLSIILDAKEPLAFLDQHPGDKITLNAEEDTYDVDIRATRGLSVTLAVSRHPR